MEKGLEGVEDEGFVDGTNPPEHSEAEGTLALPSDNTADTSGEQVC